MSETRGIRQIAKNLGRRGRKRLRWMHRARPATSVTPKTTAAMTAALDRAGASGVILVENDLPDHYA